MSELMVIESEELRLVEESKAEQIKAVFSPMYKLLKGFEEKYDVVVKEAENGIDEDVTKKAKRLRLDIAKVRIESEKIRKAQKEEYLRAGKAIDGVNNILKFAVVEKEKKLQEIEKHFEILEQKRLEKLQVERVDLLSKYVDDAHERDLKSMDDDVWAAYLSTKKKEYDDRIEAEKQAELERIEHERQVEECKNRKNKIVMIGEVSFLDKITIGMEQKDFNEVLKAAEQSKKKRIAEEEAIRKENERLKKEAERQAKIEAERVSKEEAEKKKREEKQRKEREALEAKIKAERQEKERIEREEREKREKVEAELKAKEEAELKAREEEEKRIQQELSMSDKQKVSALFDELKNTVKKYEFKSHKNKKMRVALANVLNEFIESYN